MHPEVDNGTPFAASLAFLGGANEAALFAVVVIQASYGIGEDDRLFLEIKQPEVNLAGRWLGDPATSSCLLEPQIAYCKPSTDVVLRGTAVPEGGRPTNRMVMGIRIGNVQKAATVVGDRRLERGLNGLSISPPLPFDRMPVEYERAFGGWDRRHTDPALHHCDPRNPAGVAYRDPQLPACEEPRLPNIEDPAQPYAGPGSLPPPCGFGFIGPAWQPRRAFAGTYGEAWERERSPHLPSDFDTRFFNAASPGLIMPAPLSGNEDVTVIGMSSAGPSRFRLPGVQPMVCDFSLRRGKPTQATPILDTVIVDMDHRQLTLQWRSRVALRAGPHDLVGLNIRAVGEG